MFKLPPLPYNFDALEPYIDARTMELHYTKHHQAYVTNLNAACEKHPELFNKTVEELIADIANLPADVRTAIRNNGGGHYNHSLFWDWMKKSGGGEPRGYISEELEKQFGSFEAFKEELTTAAKTQFGSGWAWLVLNQAGNLEVTQSADQDSPLTAGYTPLLGIDVWEHAYYLKYQNRRVDYIAAWWEVVHWDRVEDLYRKYVR
jgi:superoxide dismutase, Fe-Mn family